MYVPARRVLERAFSFALAIQHTQEVALAAEVRTHVLKLAALVDVDLLCHIIKEPFRKRLLRLGARRPVGQRAATCNLLNGARAKASATAMEHAFEIWGEEVDLLCDRVVCGIR